MNNRSSKITTLCLVFLFCGILSSSGKTPKNSTISSNTITSFNTGGYVGQYVETNERLWVHPLLTNNPNLFGAFLDPEGNTLFKCMWHGEFPGKILTGIAQVYLTSHDPATLEVGNKMVDALGKAQWEDGYLGPWRATERFNNPQEKWDTWGHYHCMYGFYEWYKVTGNQKALDIAIKAADGIYRYFIDGKITFASQNWAECNFAIGHILALLYQETQTERYLETAEYIVNTEWEIPYNNFYTKSTLSCDWLTAAKEGKGLGHSNQKRWESLYPLTTLATLYQITGNPEYYAAMETIWWDGIASDRHNTGSFGTDEGANGDIYGDGTETCNTVAWMTFSTEYLKLCKDSYVADELELAYFNAIMGSRMDNGKEFVYHNPSDGLRHSSQIELAPHSYDGAREMNCCQASGMRGLSNFTQWGVLTDASSVFLNYYGESKVTTQAPDGSTFTIDQQTAYPKEGLVRIKLSLERPQSFTMALRIPVWSVNPTVKVNGKLQKGVTPRTYCEVSKKWKTGDVIEIDMGLSFHYWVGQQRVNGRTSVYYGPILLSICEASEKALTHKLTNKSFANAQPVASGDHWLCFSVPTADGQRIVLEDYATKPAETHYTTWLNIETGLSPISFSKKSRPIWVNR